MGNRSIKSPRYLHGGNAHQAGGHDGSVEPFGQNGDGGNERCPRPHTGTPWLTARVMPPMTLNVFLGPVVAAVQATALDRNPQWKSAAEQQPPTARANSSSGRRRYLWNSWRVAGSSAEDFRARARGGFFCSRSLPQAHAGKFDFELGIPRCTSSNIFFQRSNTS